MEIGLAFKKKETLVENLICLVPPFGIYPHVEVVDSYGVSLKCSLSNDNRNHLVNFNKSNDVDDYTIIYFDITPAQHKRLTNEMKELDNTKHDKWGLFTFIFRINFSYGHRYFCSEASTKIMNSIGFKFKTKEYRMNPQQMFNEAIKMKYSRIKWAK